MPGGFPISRAIANPQTLNGVGGTTWSCTSANTAGNFVVAVASTTYDLAELFVMLVGFNSGTGTVTMAADIAIGATGSEKLIAQQLVCSGDDNDGYIGTYYRLPIAIKAGTQISVRGQINVGTSSATVNLIGHDGSFVSGESFAGIDALGFVSASTHGTQIDPGATANVKGSFVQITGSTARDYAGFFIALDALNQTASSLGIFPFFNIDIAVGAASSEKIIVSDMPAVYETASGCIMFLPKSTDTFWIEIPSGTPISVRAQCTTNNATYRLFGITLYGIYQ